MTWKQLAERDCREWKLSAINHHDRTPVDLLLDLHQASYLEEGPLMWILPLYLHVNKKSGDADYDDDDDDNDDDSTFIYGPILI